MSVPSPTIGDFKIRRHYDERTKTWLFSVIDIIAALIEQTDFKKAQSYWTTLKNRLKNEGNESVTKCHQLKLEATDGKKYLTDVADKEQELCIKQKAILDDLKSFLMTLKSF
ncbi:MAG: hypothetical protein WC897_00150 [Candidatus Gracilibacteria bacterium]